MYSKMIDFGGSRDVISSLPDELSCHVLSFLPTKEAASTSVLSKRWKHLLAFVPNLEFDDSIYMHPRVSKQEKEETRTTSLIGSFYLHHPEVGTTNTSSTSFTDFVDSVLALQGNAPLKRFHLKCKDVVDPYWVFDDWIPKVLERGVLDLDLYISSEWDDCYSESGYYPLPSEIFVSKTLVRLKIGVRDGVAVDVEDDISLPKLQTLHLDHVWIENNMFPKLLSGCHELEELVVTNLMWDSWEPFSVSNTTLKRLKFCGPKVFDESCESMSFDTPNLVHLEYFDIIAIKYPQVNLGSVVEASLGLRLTRPQIKRIRYYAEDDEAEPDREMMLGDVTNLLMGIRNVKILYLSDETIEVLNYCCETMPVFDNLIHLTIKTHQEVGWKSLSALLKNCPTLETLVFQGLHHRLTNTCGEDEGCLCDYCEEYEEEKEVPSCLSSSPVKVLKILKFGEILGDDDMEEQIKQIKYFLETMPNLEQVIVYYDTLVDEDVRKVSSQLQRLPKVASSKCKIQVISDYLCLSSTMPSSVSSKWGPLPHKIDSDFSATEMFPNF